MAEIKGQYTLRLICAKINYFTRKRCAYYDTDNLI